MHAEVVIGGTRIASGERRSLDLPVARLYTHANVTLPIQVIRGHKDGPRLFVSAAVHGDEINGVEIIRRLLALKSLSKLRGLLIAVPVVNVFGLINLSRYLPDRRDLNRSFPGSERGSLAGRLAHLFMQEIVQNATLGIDLHTGSNHRTNLPQIRARLDDPETERLARAFGAPVILDSTLRDGSLREAVAEWQIPMLLYEAGEALRFNEFAIRAGVKGVVSVMRAIGMLPPARSRKRRFEPLISKSSAWLRAPKSGFLQIQTHLGDSVAKGETLGVISDPFGGNSEEVKAQAAGVIIGLFKLPLVHRGDALFHLAHFDDEVPVEETMEAFEDNIDLQVEAFV